MTLCNMKYPANLKSGLFLEMCIAFNNRLSLDYKEAIIYILVSDSIHILKHVEMTFFAAYIHFFGKFLHICWQELGW